LREVVEHRGAAAIVPLTRDRNVVLVRQYRYAVGTELLEIPAGTLESGESSEECAVRELEEETGYKAGEIKKIMEVFMVPGYGTERITLYLAEGLVKSQMQTEEDEKITVETIPLSSALEKVRSGEIRDAKSVCGLLRTSELLSPVFQS
jgi:ADP-ribose pyrophosphatase